MKHRNVFFIVSMTVFVMYSIKTDEWIGIERHWPWTTKKEFWYSGSYSKMYDYCSAHTRDNNCAVINAYLLLMEQPNKNVAQQIELYEKDMLSLEQKIDSTTDFIDKRTLQLHKSKIQEVVSQIKKAPFFEKPEDKDTQEKLGAAVNAILAKESEYQIANDLRFLRRAEWHARHF